MRFSSEEDLIKAVEIIKHTPHDIKIILKIFNHVMTINTWRHFTITTLSQDFMTCSYSEQYMFATKTEARNVVFEELLGIDKKIGMYRECDTVCYIISYFCFDIWQNNRIIQVHHHFYYSLNTIINDVSN